MENLTTDLDMQDLIGRMYNKLDEEGYHGYYVDERTNELEKQLHETHKAVMKRLANKGHFRRLCIDFFEHYKKHAPLRDENAEWLRRMEETGECQQ